MKTRSHNKKLALAFSMIAVFLTAWALAASGCGSDGNSGDAGPAATSASAGARTAAYPNTVVNLSAQVIGISGGDSFVSFSDQALESAMADISSLGVTWLRFDVAWDIVQPENTSRFDWSSYDRIAAAANRHNLKMVPVLAYAPRWARDPSCVDNFRCMPADPAQFAIFAAETVRHFSPVGIKAWEIWNEPNTSAFWLPAPDAIAYTNLLRESYTKIKAADPQAAVISGGLSPAESVEGQIAPRDFLVAMYQSGARDFFDALGYHPVSYPALPSDVLSWSAWSQMSDLSPSIIDIMNANGDRGKPVWATEYGVPSQGIDDVDENLQALSYRDAIQQMSNKPWLGAIFFHTYLDLASGPHTSNDYFGIIRGDGARKPAYDVLKQTLASR